MGFAGGGFPDGDFPEGFEFPEDFPDGGNGPGGTRPDRGTITGFISTDSSGLDTSIFFPEGFFTENRVQEQIQLQQSQEQLPSETETESVTVEDDNVEKPSRKGLLANGNILLSGGVIKIISEDDCIHAKGNITITDGVFELETGENAICAYHNVLITGGNIDVIVSYEGIEGLSVTIEGGHIKIYASDDGLNASSSNAYPELVLEKGQIDEHVFIRISGGTLDLYAHGDGIDSNGNNFLEGAWS